MINSNNNVTINKIITHGGIFHADDVMTVALATMINPNVEVERVFKVPDGVSVEGLVDGIIVADIGMGHFDHHQTDCQLRDDGGKHAACGIFFDEFGDLIFPDSSSATRFRDTYIIPIEEQDNGVSNNPFSMFIASFNPNWDDDCSSDDCFWEAVHICRQLIVNAVDSAKSRIAAQSIVSAALAASDSKVLVLPQFAPWQGYVVGTDILFCVFPSNRGGFNINTVPVGDGTRNSKLLLPESWLTNKPEGCSFIHPARFIATFDTQEQAVAAAHAAIDAQ